MSHPSVNLHVFRKEAKVFTFALIDRRTREGRSLDGKTLTLTVRLTLDQIAADIQLSTGSGIVHDADQTANPGKFVATFSAGDTEVAPGDYFWDLHEDDEVIVGPGIVPSFEVTRSARYGPA